MNNGFTRLWISGLPIVINVDVLGRDYVETIRVKTLNVGLYQYVRCRKVKWDSRKLIKGFGLSRDPARFADQPRRLVFVRHIILDVRGRWLFSGRDRLWLITASEQQIKI